ncbi:hypothetical protein LTS18_009418 [Coniosporium uncinatum]|uniref:Uncharacterized protein n=1 Tax=Coniosporium uncinatum TaxID=93489 RepID=A0ACC3DMC0_9PEZI|nr:hypothetical protein LTS18_009418 [Coniosporium uncinatum]
MAMLSDCFPSPRSADETNNNATAMSEDTISSIYKRHVTRRHAVAMSGTGNGDSFLRLSAVRTAAAMSRFSTPNMPLAEAVRRIAGPKGALQESAGDRFGHTGEGEGGIIGIELVDDKSDIVWNFNCGGMFRAWVDDDGRERCMVFKDEY